MSTQRVTDDTLLPSVFTFPLEGVETPIRVVQLPDGAPGWVLKDVCNVIGSKPDNFTRVLEPKECPKVRIPTGQGTQRTTVVTEAALYRIFLRAQRNKEVVKKFQDWVAGVVLPTIRKTGSYVVGEEHIGSGASSKEAQAVIQKALEKIAVLESRVLELENVEAAFIQITNKERNAVSVRQVARKLDGVNLSKVMKTLVDRGYLKGAPGRYSVPAQYLGRYFSEYWQAHKQCTGISVLPHGVALMERLYREGAFPMKKRTKLE